MDIQQQFVYTQMCTITIHTQFICLLLQYVLKFPPRGRQKICSLFHCVLAAYHQYSSGQNSFSALYPMSTVCELCSTATASAGC